MTWRSTGLIRCVRMEALVLTPVCTNTTVSVSMVTRDATVKRGSIMVGFLEKYYFRLSLLCTHSLSFSHTYISHTNTYFVPLLLFHSSTNSVSLSHTHTHSFFLSLAHSPTNPLAYSPTTHSLTHSHTLPPSLPPSLRCVQ